MVYPSERHTIALWMKNLDDVCKYSVIKCLFQVALSSYQGIAIVDTWTFMR